MERVALYVDGFNLYHALDETGKNHLKWLNLWKLGERILELNRQALVKVVYCTAIPQKNQAKAQRHRTYINALKHHGVAVLEGHFSSGEITCSSCNVSRIKPEEKQTDLNIGLSVFADAMHDLYDRAMILTADTDQRSTVSFVKEHFPSKLITAVIPPGRAKAFTLSNLCDQTIALNQEYIEDSLLDAVAIEQKERGQVFIYKRPDEYKPPWE